MKANWLWFYFIAALSVVIISWLFVGFQPSVDLAAKQKELHLIYDDSWRSLFAINYQLVVLLIDDFLVNRLPGSQLGWLTFLMFSTISLVVFHLARRLQQNQRDWISFLNCCYFGPSQIVPYVIVSLFVCLQILPAFVVNNILSSFLENNFLPTPESQLLMIILVVLFNFFCLYLLAGSIFGLIVVSLPGCRPLAAFKSSWSVSQGRRGLIGRHIFGLVIIMTILTFVVMMPIIHFLAQYAEFFFNFWLVLAFSYCHLSLYRLYSQLITK